MTGVDGLVKGMSRKRTGGQKDRGAEGQRNQSSQVVDKEVSVWNLYLDGRRGEDEDEGEGDNEWTN